MDCANVEGKFEGLKGFCSAWNLVCLRVISRKGKQRARFAQSVEINLLVSSRKTKSYTSPHIPLLFICSAHRFDSVSDQEFVFISAFLPERARISKHSAGFLADG